MLAVCKGKWAEKLFLAFRGGDPQALRCLGRGSGWETQLNPVPGSCLSGVGGGTSVAKSLG